MRQIAQAAQTIEFQDRIRRNGTRYMADLQVAADLAELMTLPNWKAPVVRIPFRV